MCNLGHFDLRSDSCCRLNQFCGVSPSSRYRCFSCRVCLGQCFGELGIKRVQTSTKHALPTRSRMHSSQSHEVIILVHDLCCRGTIKQRRQPGAFGGPLEYDTSARWSAPFPHLVSHMDVLWFLEISRCSLFKSVNRTMCHHRLTLLRAFPSPPLFSSPRPSEVICFARPSAER